MRKLLRMNPIPDGICCYNDSVAIGTSKAIVVHKLRAPDDVAVIGAGNVRYSDLLVVPLPTMDPDIDQIGQQACQLVLEQMGAKQILRPNKVLIAPKLESCFVRFRSNG
jgi:LacI family transcriptional regulator